MLSKEVAGGVIDEISEAYITVGQNPDNSNTNLDSNNNPNVAVGDRDDEVLPEPINNDKESDIESNIASRHQVTRSGRISKLHDYKEHFPETAHMQES